MSRNVNGVVVIEAEPDFLCFKCGKVAETRPYGPNGEEICYECGMADRETTDGMMAIKLFGDAPSGVTK